MNLTESIAPRSDQLNADDLISGPVTVTIQEVVKGTAEQPVDVRLVEFPGRAYRPSKSMRRVMVMAWGVDAATYTGHRLTLYRNPDITFGKDRVGGIEISHLTHLDKPLTVALTATRGKRKSFTVQPLKEAPKPAQNEPTTAPVRDWKALADQAAGDVPTLQSMYAAAEREGATPEALDYIKSKAAA